MTKRTIVFFAIAVSISPFNNKTWSQEYKYEIGATAGISAYMGDANRTSPFLNPGFATGILHRYNLSLNWAVKSNLIVANISGDTKNAKNVFPMNGQASFKRTFFELGSQMEYNFFPFSDKFSYLDTKPYTPYIFTGVGATFATGGHRFFNLNLPVGIGFKYKFKERFNVGIEFSMRKLLGDDLDVTHKGDVWNLDTPFGIKSGVFKNKDWYSLTMMHVTWEFGRKYDPCCGP